MRRRGRILTRALSENEQDVLHAKLGDVYVIAGEERYRKKPGSYHAALSLNPASDAARPDWIAWKAGRRRPGPERRARPLCGDDDDDAPDAANSAHDVGGDALRARRTS